MQANFGFFVGKLMPAIGSYEPDFALLRAAGPRLIIAGGEQSGCQLPYLGAAAAAQRLGLDLTPFPGDHAGLWADPATSIPRLRELLAGH